MNVYRALIFDAYGTMLDTGSVARACEARFPGSGAELSRLWRQRQLEYSWLRSLMNRHADFWQVTGDALAFACTALGLEADAATLAELRNCYRALDAFVEVPPALAQLAPRRRIVLSNGTAAMLTAALGHAGLLQELEEVLSVEAAGIFKPAPQVYALATSYLGCEPDEALFVSANGWDVSGAASFGLRTCWLNRSDAPFEVLEVTPTICVRDLAELAALLRSDYA